MYSALRTSAAGWTKNCLTAWLGLFSLLCFAVPALALDRVVVVVDQGISATQFAQEQAALDEFIGTADDTELAVVLYDLVVLRTLPFALAKEGIVQLASLSQELTEQGAQRRSNSAAAVERAFDLLQKAGAPVEKETIFLVGGDRVSTGDEAMDQQYQTWYQSVILPQLAARNVQLLPEPTDVSTAQSPSPPTVPVAAEVPVPAQVETTPVVQQETAKEGLVWPTVVALLAVLAGALLFVIRRKKPLAEEAPVAVEEETVQTDIVPDIPQPVPVDADKTMLRPSVTAEVAVPPSPSSQTEFAGVEETTEEITAITEKELPIKAEDTEATVIRPRDV